MIYFADRRDQAIPFFVDANILPLSFLYYECVSNLMHDINNDKAPLNTLKLFQKTPAYIRTIRDHPPPEIFTYKAPG